jgi:hypothetical protein
MLFPDGSHVYGTDGTPGVAYLDGFIAGKTQASVLPPVPAADGSSTPSTTTPGTTAPSGSPEPTTSGTPVSTAGFPQAGGGCSSTGFQSAWLALPLFGLFAIRRRRSVA